MTPLPAGFRVHVDPGTRALADGVLFGGSPARFVRLSEAGQRAWRELRVRPVRTTAAGALARRLTDAGLAHPGPPTVHSPDVTVIIPVRDRPALLARCLTALGQACRVIVVDDGSVDRHTIADVAARHGATLVRQDNAGPGAARNAGLALADTELVAFLDSDCVPPAGWIDALAPHFADPLVAAVAPRVVALPATTWAGRHAAVSGVLDLGDRPARVVPGTRVSYVPTAALLVRRIALPDPAFDPALRYGEDVDLVWRMHEADWRIRYHPSVALGHREPTTWQALLARRFRYGTSAGLLAKRHPDSMAPVVLLPWPTVTVCAALVGSPLAVVGLAATMLDIARTLRGADLPLDGVPTATLRAIRQTYSGIARYSTQFAAPLLLAALVAPGRNRRIAVAALLLGRPLATWVARRPPLDPIRFVLGSIAEDVAYGAGVAVGSVRSRTTAPLRPRFVRRLR